MHLKRNKCLKYVRMNQKIRCVAGDAQNTYDVSAFAGSSPSAVDEDLRGEDGLGPGAFVHNLDSVVEHRQSPEGPASATVLRNVLVAGFSEVISAVDVAPVPVRGDVRNLRMEGLGSHFERNRSNTELFQGVVGAHPHLLVSTGSTDLLLVELGRAVVFCCRGHRYAAYQWNEDRSEQSGSAVRTAPGLQVAGPHLVASS